MGRYQTFCRDRFRIFLGQTDEVALDIREKDRNPCLAHLLSQDLEGDGFSCTGRSGDDAMAIEALELQLGHCLTIAKL